MKNAYGYTNKTNELDPHIDVWQCKKNITYLCAPWCLCCIEEYEEKKMKTIREHRRWSRHWQIMIALSSYFIFYPPWMIITPNTMFDMKTIFLPCASACPLMFCDRLESSIRTINLMNLHNRIEPADVSSLAHWDSTSGFSGFISNEWIGWPMVHRMRKNINLSLSASIGYFASLEDSGASNSPIIRRHEQTMLLIQLLSSQR